MLASMSLVLDAFWRALAYCFHPRIIMLSLMPLLISAGLALGLSWFFWEPAVQGVRLLFDQWTWLKPVLDWLNGVSSGAFAAVIGPLVVVALSVPVLLIISLVLVSAFMGGAIAELVARRRFPALEAAGGGGLGRSLLWSLSSMLLALALLTITLPLWLIPPVPLLLPPLIWGWLAYRVMSYDALNQHASRLERREVMKRHRGALFVMGLVTGYLGAAPSLVWVATGVMALPMMPLLLPVFIWLYTLVFAFAALWFTHFALAALERVRQSQLREVVPVDVLPDAPQPSALPGKPEAEPAPDRVPGILP
jgi:Etoposide-induced protein 2.4 (EI24)